MGGGIALFKSARQYEKLTSDLKKVEFYIISRDEINTSLLDMQSVHEEVVGVIERYLKKYSIKGKQIFAEMGGGGWETFLDILRLFRDNWDIIAFIISSFKWVKSNVERNLIYKFNNAKPKMDINFRIVSDEPIDKIETPEIIYLIRNYLGSLFLVSTDITRELSNKFSFFSFTFSDEFVLSNPGYSVSLTVPYSHQKELDYAKMLDKIKYLKFKTNQSIGLRFNKFSIVKRINHKRV